jgi:hypothetical protein
MQQNDVYAISGRIKNIIAKEGIALSPAGTILINYFTLLFKDLYDFSDSIPPDSATKLRYLLRNKEDLPKTIIRLTTPKEQYITIYEEVMKMKPKFETNEEALEHFKEEYEALGQKHGLTGEEFWADAESSAILTEDHRTIMRLRRSIQMCTYLIEKEHKDG